ncbi:MAG: NifB/NifX family molybdenum-iron cluster-binding protein [Thermodesulfovibrionia bacterium]|nr:NifB/NifX family molybdenum-iron cluster-binding protein [Thermodesulfovibrionia bacterium]
MQNITLAIPSETTEGLTGKRSDHFGHCPVFTLVEIKDNQIGEVRTVANIAHTAGGCLKPVAMLAENGVSAMVVAGMGRGPFQKMQQHGITVYFADLQKYPDVQSTVNDFINGSLLTFEAGQLCTGNGQCHH